MINVRVSVEWLPSFTSHHGNACMVSSSSSIWELTQENLVNVLRTVGDLETFSTRMNITAVTSYFSVDM